MNENERDYNFHLYPFDRFLKLIKRTTYLTEYKVIGEMRTSTHLTILTAWQRCENSGLLQRNSSDYSVTGDTDDTTDVCEGRHVQYKIYLTTTG